MLKINYNGVGVAIGATNENSTVEFVQVGYAPTLHSNLFFDFYIGEDNLIYRVVPNGNSRAVYVEEGITEIEMQQLVEELKKVPVKRMVLKLKEDKSDSNDFLWKNLETVVGIIDYSEKAEDLIRNILSDVNSDAYKALEHIKLGYKESNFGFKLTDDRGQDEWHEIGLLCFLLTDWGYYGSISSKGCIKLLRTPNGQIYLTCPV